MENQRRILRRLSHKIMWEKIEHLFDYCVIGNLNENCFSLSQNSYCKLLKRMVRYSWEKETKPV